MVIAWKEHSGLKYLKSQNAAICINKIGEIEEVLRNILDNPSLVSNFAEKAYECGKKITRLKMFKISCGVIL